MTHVERPCTTCNRSIPMEDVVTWPDATRAWWFLTGMCDDCQRRNRQS